MTGDETGFTICWTKDNSTYRLPVEVFEELKAAWMSGKAFFETTSYWGAKLVIKLASVESIQLSTPESIKAWKEEVESDKYEEH